MPSADPPPSGGSKPLNRCRGNPKQGSMPSSDPPPLGGSEPPKSLSGAGSPLGLRRHLNSPSSLRLRRYLNNVLRIVVVPKLPPRAGSSLWLRGPKRDLLHSSRASAEVRAQRCTLGNQLLFLRTSHIYQNTSSGAARKSYVCCRQAKSIKTHGLVPLNSYSELPKLCAPLCAVCAHTSAAH